MDFILENILGTGNSLSAKGAFFSIIILGFFYIFFKYFTDLIKHIYDSWSAKKEKIRELDTENKRKSSENMDKLSEITDKLSDIIKDYDKVEAKNELEKAKDSIEEFKKDVRNEILNLNIKIIEISNSLSNLVSKETNKKLKDERPKN